MTQSEKLGHVAFLGLLVVAAGLGARSFLREGRSSEVDPLANRLAAVRRSLQASDLERLAGRAAALEERIERIASEGSAAGRSSDPGPAPPRIDPTKPHIGLANALRDAEIDFVREAVSRSARAIDLPEDRIDAVVSIYVREKTDRRAVLARVRRGELARGDLEERLAEIEARRDAALRERLGDEVAGRLLAILPEPPDFLSPSGAEGD